MSTTQLIYTPGHINMYICLSVGQLTGCTRMHWQMLQCSIFSMSLGFLGGSGRRQSFCRKGDVKSHGASGKGRPGFAGFAAVLGSRPPPLHCSPSLALSLFLSEQDGAGDGYACIFYIRARACVSALLI